MTPAHDLRFPARNSLEILLIHRPPIRDYNLYVQGRLFNSPSRSHFSVVIGMAVAPAVTLFLSDRLHRPLTLHPHEH